MLEQVRLISRMWDTHLANVAVLACFRSTTYGHEQSIILKATGTGLVEFVRTLYLFLEATTVSYIAI